VHRKNLVIGRSGEELAVAFLEKSGYKILARNYKTRLGEIDIVAYDSDTICFVEVKTRRSDNYGLPQEAVGGFKQRQIAKAALAYLKENNLFPKKSRFDIVCVFFAGDKPRLELIRNAFELDESFTY